MTTLNILLIVAVILGLLALIAFIGYRVRRSRELQERFGPEYDRAVESRGGRLKAESDLDERERRHRELDIRPLEPAERERYAREWATVQEHFVDEPATAATQADRLVTALMNDRGYPTESYEARTETLSVEHADTLQHYRVAHDIVTHTGGDGGPDGGLGHRERTSTESLRQAMTHYRELFDELLEPVSAGHHTERGHGPGPDGGQGPGPDGGRRPGPEADRGFGPEGERGFGPEADRGFGPEGDRGRGPEGDRGPGVGPGRTPGHGPDLDPGPGRRPGRPG